MTLRASQLLVASLLCTTCCILSQPVVEETKTLVDAIEIVAEGAKTQDSSINQNQNKLRQDGEGDGAEGGDTPETPDITNVGSNVAQIVSGVIGGNFDNIFAGTANFIGEEDTKTGVSTIFNSLSKPLTTIFQTGGQRVASYFGFGNATTIRPGTAAGVPAAAGTQGTGTGQAGTAAVLPQAAVAPAVEAAPAPPRPPPSEKPSEEDEDETDSDIEAKL